MRSHGIHIFDNIVEILEIIFTPRLSDSMGKCMWCMKHETLKQKQQYKIFCIFTSLQIMKDREK